MARGPRHLRAALVVAALAVLGPGAGSAAAVEPIEGSWFFSGGEVLVEPTGPGTFKGTVIQPTTFSECTHPRGERMWEMSGSGSSYSGTHQYFFIPSCSPNPGGRATWVIRSGGNILDFCSVEPGRGEPGPSNPNTRCHALERSAPPPRRDRACASAGGRVCVDGPAELRTIGCLQQRDFSHRFRVRMLIRRRGRGLVNRRSRVTIVRFTLDGRPNGTDRRRPFYARVNAATLAPGAHILRADVRLRVPGTRQRYRKRFAFRFNVCG